MSQHRYTHKSVTVIAGWDRPMRQIFLSVLDTESNDTEYCHLLDAKADGVQYSKHFKDVLNDMSIPYPEGFWNHVEMDRLSNTGNAYTHWGDI